MFEFKKFILDNGLVLIVNEDYTTPLVAINVLYKVGSRDEDENRTGFAHLFEHLMFGGSKNIPSFDEPLQMVGGDNNAFTNSDITNYYVTVPSENIETALWLESDRMLELNFSNEGLKVQQNVVTEEFRQRYLNQPYGDIWLLLRPLAYKKHSYQWPTIGKSISHIQDATLSDVKSFFYSHYAPNNAVITISGNIKSEKALKLVEKWFGDIPNRSIKQRNIPAEPVQNEGRLQTVNRKVPYDAVYKAWHIGGRTSQEFLVTDLITDTLSSGKSARLYQQLVKEQKLFSEINAFVTGEADPGLLIVGGKLFDGVSAEKANGAVNSFLADFTEHLPDANEMQKVKNKFEFNFMMGQTNILNKAMGLSLFEMLGDASMALTEMERYNKITTADIRETAKQVFKESNCSTLFYLSERSL